jgi:hypothetical protein
MSRRLIPRWRVQMSLSLSAGVSTNPAEWGQDFTVGPDYKGPHVRWPLTLENVHQVRLQQSSCGEEAVSSADLSSARPPPLW